MLRHGALDGPREIEIATRDVQSTAALRAGRTRHRIQPQDEQAPHTHLTLTPDFLRGYCPRSFGSRIASGHCPRLLPRSFSLETRIQQDVCFGIALHRSRALRQQLSEALLFGIEPIVDALCLRPRIVQDLFLGTYLLLI